MAERTPQDQDKYVVRFPDGMRDRLKDEAAKNNRSLNAEIIARLELTFGPAPVLDQELFSLIMEKLDEMDKRLPLMTSGIKKPKGD